MKRSDWIRGLQRSEQDGAQIVELLEAFPDAESFWDTTDSIVTICQKRAKSQAEEAKLLALFALLGINCFRGHVCQEALADGDTGGSGNSGPVVGSGDS